MILPSGIVEFYPDATLIIDNRGRVAAWNKAMEKLTGVRARDMLGRGNYEYAIPFYGERKPMLADMVGLPKKAIGDGYTDVVAESDRLEALAVNAKLKGRDVVLWVAAARLYGMDGEPAGAIESIRDVTRQTLMEEELKKARDELERRVEERTAELAKAKEQAELYLDIMGHDINNMNQVAMGYLEMANSVADECQSAALVGRAIAVLSGNSRLIGNLRKVQQATGKKLKLERVDLDAMLSRVRAEHSLAPGREVIIRYEPVRGYVMAGPLLKDVFSNIVGNAIKHSTGPVRIEIRVSRIEDGGRLYHEIAIEDNGPGIPDERKASVFSRAGGGFGLYIVKSLVEGFDGRVRVENRVAGDHSKGCRFVVALPAVE